MTGTSVENKEVARFTALADQWWDPLGNFAPLHKINPVRLEFIRDHLCELAGNSPASSTPLDGFNILDIGWSKVPRDGLWFIQGVQKPV